MKKQKSMIAILAERSFRANRGRNLVAVLAIVLTTLMFTTLFVLSESQSQNYLEMTFRQTGYDAQVSFKSITDEQADLIEKNPKVTELGRSIVLGLAENQDLMGHQLEIRWGSDSYAKHSFAFPTMGAMPKEKNEIALDTLTLERLGIPREIGQKVTLVWRKDMTGDELTTAEFVLCGYWEGNLSSYASMAWVSSAYAKEASGGITGNEAGQVLGMHMAQVNLESDKDIQKVMDGILADAGITGLEYSENLAYSPEMNAQAAQENLPMYLGMLLVFAAGYLIIYNIFQISVTADIQFYGKLKTLGMGTKQMKRIIYGQAGRLCLIGIPMGLLGGYLLGMILVPVLISYHNGEASVSASPLIFIGSALFAAFTVLVSCTRPARMAGKVSPMEALRYGDASSNGNKKKTRKRHKAPFLLAMAWSNLWRNKKRTFTVICSLTLGLVLMSCFYVKNASFDMEIYLETQIISDYQLNDATHEDFMGGYDPYNDTLNDELLMGAKNLKGLENIGELYSHETKIALNEQTLENMKKYYTEDKLEEWGSYDPIGAKAEQAALESKEASAVLYGIEGIPLEIIFQNRYLLNGSLDQEKFSSGDYVLAIGPGMDGGLTDQVMPTYSVGDQVELEGREFTVMAVVTPMEPIDDGAKEEGQSKDFYLDFIMPAKSFRQMWPDHAIRKLFIDVKDEGVKEAEEWMEGLKGVPIISRQDKIDQYKAETQASAVMGYAISVVIALVGILNFVNSMVTAIVSRKKEFAMMQSVGMAKGQLRCMLIFEGSIYAAMTLIISYFISSMGILCVVRPMVEGGFSTFRFTLLPLLLCTPVLLLFAVLIPYFCFRKMEKQSVVERLRME